ncbi:hypothetical protein NDU88_007133 [Pleurodeles waltl]|uniref:Uncharacterized protein n=1 Tax=Pleurodeles waltl TaxID=8319 RepID=A0AAV7RPF4_PLEWA|nr:hypothetical protein NDU88_007133 [Pleurodeles waltl]
MPRAPPEPRLQAPTGPPAWAAPLCGAQLPPRALPNPWRPTSSLSGPGPPRGRDRGLHALPGPHPRQHQPRNHRARAEPPMDPPPPPGRHGLRGPLQQQGAWVPGDSVLQSPASRKSSGPPYREARSPQHGPLKEEGQESTRTVPTSASNLCLMGCGQQAVSVPPGTRHAALRLPQLRTNAAVSSNQPPNQSPNHSAPKVPSSVALLMTAIRDSRRVVPGNQPRGFRNVTSQRLVSMQDTAGGARRRHKDARAPL